MVPVSSKVPSPPPVALRRRRFLVHPSLQWILVGTILGLVSLATMLVLGEYYFNFGRNMSSNLMDPGLFRLFLAGNSILMVKLFFLFVIVWGIGLLLSHRLAGPIENLRKAFQIVGDGNLSHRVRLRRRDHLQDVVEDFNTMTFRLSARYEGVFAAMQDVLRKLDDSLGQTTDTATKNQLSSLRETVARLIKSFPH
ncbi:MAG: methyl-accepting chemotaxis protein [Elusimicrobia bacterium]|nr:methyl-accepting chemotaxis protein [Elusimicrobiota bacterium]